VQRAPNVAVKGSSVKCVKCQAQLGESGRVGARRRVAHEANALMLNASTAWLDEACRLGARVCGNLEQVDASSSGSQRETVVDEDGEAGGR
jgi:hypothetical protein